MEQSINLNNIALQYSSCECLMADLMREDYLTGDEYMLEEPGLITSQDRGTLTSLPYLCSLYFLYQLDR
jgi:hypothetical protein